MRPPIFSVLAAKGLRPASRHETLPRTKRRGAEVQGAGGAGCWKVGWAGKWVAGWEVAGLACDGQVGRLAGCRLAGAGRAGRLMTGGWLAGAR